MCPRADECCLQSVIKSRVALVLWQRKCCADAAVQAKCARFRIAEEGGVIPSGMLPNGATLAEAAPAP